MTRLSERLFSKIGIGVNNSSCTKVYIQNSQTVLGFLAIISSLRSTQETTSSPCFHMWLFFLTKKCFCNLEFSSFCCFASKQQRTNELTKEGVPPPPEATFCSSFFVFFVIIMIFLLINQEPHFLLFNIQMFLPRQPKNCVCWLAKERRKGETPFPAVDVIKPFLEEM